MAASPAVGAANPNATPATLPPRLMPGVLQAPLLAPAIAFSIGILMDRTLGVPLAIALVSGSVMLAGCLLTSFSKRGGLPLLYLCLAVVSVGAAYHHGYRNLYFDHDIGDLATVEPRPIRIRGILTDEPIVYWRLPENPLRSIPHPDPTLAALRVLEVAGRDGWQPASGNARLTIDEPITGIHIGDLVEIAGRIQAPQPPANPGEDDLAERLRDQRIRALVEVRKTSAAIHSLNEGSPFSPRRALMWVRQWGQRRLAQVLPPEQAGVAGALLLGEGSTMTSEAWQRYIRTGIIHVLAISGTHLMILAGFLWLIIRAFRIRRLPGALVVSLFLIAYAVLTGGRPPAIRAAATIAAGAGALCICRIPVPINCLAISWLIVLAFNPSDIVNAGCQLSFLAVTVIYLASPIWRRPMDPLRQLELAGRSAWRRTADSIWRSIRRAYCITMLIWVIAAPLVAAHYHLLSPIGLLIAPPMLLISTLALLSGFLLLVAAGTLSAIVPVFAFILSASLAVGEWLVALAERIPYGHLYIGDLPTWWIAGFYAITLAWLGMPGIQTPRRWVAVASVWLAVGWCGYHWRFAPPELRITFLAVGHGGCTVMETPDDHVLIYDAGALGGPDVTRHIIAPFLWNLGIHRIDEVFLSHADLDHFNGLPDLVERFQIGLVTVTPSFAQKPIEGVPVALEAVASRGVATRIVFSGDRLATGNVAFEVLHPPPVGPEGNENSRSMVLRIEHAGHAFLLTGDLEAAGLDRVLSMRPRPLDVLMAPHHGSRAANTPRLAAWAAPKLVIACLGPPRNPPLQTDPYTMRGIPYWGTWPHGAVIIHSDARALVIDTFLSHQHLDLSNR